MNKKDFYDAKDALQVEVKKTAEALAPHVVMEPNGGVFIHGDLDDVEAFYGWVISNLSTLTALVVERRTM